MPPGEGQKLDETSTIPKALAQDCHIPFLPPEILDNVSEYMQKADLKQLRLTSKSCCQAATARLFDHVYISPHAKDLNVFERITSQLCLRTSIKEIIYDVSCFHHLSRWEYVGAFCRSIRSQLRPWRRAAARIEYPRGIKRLASDIERSGTDPESIVSKYVNHGWAREGHTEWQRLVDEEQILLNRGILLKALTKGLSHLPNLLSVDFDDRLWRRVASDNEAMIRDTEHGQHLKLNDNGSPLCRTWKMYYPRPCKALDCTDHVVLVLKALCHAGSNIRNLKIKSWSDKGLPPAMFRQLQIQNGLGCEVALNLYRLEQLHLQITPSEFNRAKDHRDMNALAFLPQLLSRLDGLKDLYIKLETSEDVTKEIRFWDYPDRTRGRPYYSYEQIFPTATRWERLTMLHITGLAITGIDLFHLVFSQAPFLQRLWLRHIELLEIWWESLVELFRQRRNWGLLSFHGMFQHCSGQWWPLDLPTHNNELGEWEILQEVNNYVRYGGRHPSLPVHASDADSAAYLHDFFRCTTPGQSLQELTQRIQHWR